MKPKALLILLILAATQGTCLADMEKDIQQAEVLFVKGDFSAAVSAYEKLLAENPKKHQRHAIECMLAVSYIKTNKAQEANDLLAKLLARELDKELQAQARLAYGDSWLALDKPDKAYFEYESIIKESPSSGIASTAAFKAAEIKRMVGDWEDSKKLYRLVISRYPQSFEASLSQDILVNGDFFYSVQVGSYSRADNAQKLADQLISKGYDAYVKEFKSAGATYYRVRVGKCAQRQEAVSLESRLQGEGLPTKIFP